MKLDDYSLWLIGGVIIIGLIVVLSKSQGFASSTAAALDATGGFYYPYLYNGKGY